MLLFLIAIKLFTFQLFINIRNIHYIVYIVSVYIVCVYVCVCAYIYIKSYKLPEIIFLVLTDIV